MVQIETFQLLGCGGIAYQAMWGLRNLIRQHWALMSPDRLNPKQTRLISTIDGETYEEHNDIRQGFGLDAPIGTAKADAFLWFFLGALNSKIISGKSHVGRLGPSGVVMSDYVASLSTLRQGLTLLLCCPDNNQCRIDAWGEARMGARRGQPPYIVLMAGCEQDFGQVTLGFSLGNSNNHSPFALTPTVLTNPGGRGACRDQTIQANINTAFLLLDAVGWVLANLDDILSLERPQDYPFPNWFWEGSPMRSWVQTLTQTEGGS